ncbi:MAG TPA: FtsX-like permease family protein, partial [Acidimicrobiales bacterium]|nr:FtsX-like permease family protein [Acidimicrobiales bacterium]
APPTAVIGVRRAVDRGRGPGSVPVGNALVGAAVAVAALCGTAVFGASLHQLTSTPRLYGQAFQMWMSGNGPGPDAVAGPEARLAADHTVTDLTLGVSGSTVINGVATDSIGGQPVKGRLLIIPTKGRDPVAPDEVALGVKTMQAVGAHIGSTVKVNVPLAEGGGGRKSPFRVVGEVSFPADFGVVGLGRGAVFTIDGLVGAQCPLGTAGAPCRQTLRSQLSYVLLAGVQPGPAGRAAVASYIRRYPDQATLPVVPARLVNFGQAVDFPLILAVLVAVFGAASLIHVLVVSVGRRRREVGLLKALGFVRPQVIATVGWQATTVALVGVAIGVPAGLAGGRAVWRAFAVNLGFVPVPVISPGVIALIAAGVVVAVNVLAVGPAVASASMPAAVALRTE